jgi:hypothetical protein
MKRKPEVVSVEDTSLALVWLHSATTKGANRVEAKQIEKVVRLMSITLQASLLDDLKAIYKRLEEPVDFYDGLGRTDKKMVKSMVEALSMRADKSLNLSLGMPFPASRIRKNTEKAFLLIQNRITESGILA